MNENNSQQGRLIHSVGAKTSYQRQLVNASAINTSQFNLEVHDNNVTIRRNITERGVVTHFP